MPFDWFTIVAQCINFIVLLWLLKRFLYKPIIDGLDAREARLQSVLSAAQIKQSQAEALEQKYQKKHQTFEQERHLILKTSQQEAEAVAKNLVELAHTAADDMLRKRLGAIQQELHSLQQQVLKQNIEEVYATVGKMLSDLAGLDLQQIMLRRFLDRLQTLPQAQYTNLVNALKRSNNNIVIRSAYALSTQEKVKIKEALSSLLGNKAPVDFNFSFIHVPKLMAGLELSVSGWKLAWSIKQHLQSLQQSVVEALQLNPLPSSTKAHLEVPDCMATKPKEAVE